MKWNLFGIQLEFGIFGILNPRVLETLVSFKVEINLWLIGEPRVTGNMRKSVATVKTRFVLVLFAEQAQGPMCQIPAAKCLSFYSHDDNAQAATIWAINKLCVG